MGASSKPSSSESLQVVYSAWHIWNIAADAAKRASDIKTANPAA